MLSLILPIAILATLTTMFDLERRLSDQRLAMWIRRSVHLLQALPFLALAYLFIIDDQNFMVYGIGFQSFQKY